MLLERRSRVAVAPFEALIHEPANNIYVHPQDTIYVYKEPQTFLALGAFTKQGQVPFDAWRLTLAEALAKGGGLLDDHAEPAWVFVYRAERQHVAQELDRDCAVTQGPYVPVVYQLNLRDPAGLFLATQFPVRNKDAIYISNSRTVEAQKLMEHIRILNATIKEPVDTAISVYTLKSSDQGHGDRCGRGHDDGSVIADAPLRRRIRSGDDIASARLPASIGLRPIPARSSRWARCRFAIMGASARSVLP